MNSDDVGKVFRKEDGSYWVMFSYLSEPGVSFRRIDNGATTIMVGVNSLIARGYERVDLPPEIEDLLWDLSQNAPHP